MFRASIETDNIDSAYSKTLCTAEINNNSAFCFRVHSSTYHIALLDSQSPLKSYVIPSDFS